MKLISMSRSLFKKLCTQKLLKLEIRPSQPRTDLAEPDEARHPPGSKSMKTRVPESYAPFTYIHTYIHTYLRAYVHAYIHTHVLKMYLCICKFVYIYIYIDVIHTHTHYTYLYTYMYMYIYIYVYKYNFMLVHMES